MIEAFLALTTLEQTVVLAVPAALLLVVAVLAARLAALCAKTPPRESAYPLTGVPRAREVRVSRVHNIGGREEQQDCMAVSPTDDRELTSAKGVLAVVADGMGGLADGGEISMRAAGAMLQSFMADSAGDTPRCALLRGLCRANGEISAYLGEEGLRKCGSTLVAANIRGGELWWISVGDSRVFLYRGGGVIALNRRHNYGAELDVMAACGQLDAGSALTDAHRGELTSYLGMGPLRYVDGSTVPLKLLPGDRVILASDGVSEVLTQSELAETQQCPVEESARRIESAVLAKARQHQDNFTAVIMEYA